MARSEKTDKTEIEKRIRVIQEWLIDDWHTADIKSEIIRIYGVCSRQAERYIVWARKRWTVKEDERLEQKRRRKIEGLKKLKRTLRPEYRGTPKGINAILHVDREICKLEDLYPAEKHELTGKDGKPLIPTRFKVVIKKKKPDELG